MGEVGEHVGLVEPGHGDLGDDHLLEGGEGAEDALPAGLGAEARGHGEVVALHDAAVHVHLRTVLADMVQAAGALQVAIDHQHPAGGLVQLSDQVADDAAELVPVLGELRGAAAVHGLGALGRRLAEQGNGRLVTAAGEIVDGHGHRDDVVALGQPLDARHTHGHLALDDHGRRPGGGDRRAHGSEQGVQVLAVAGLHGQAVSAQGAGQIVAGHVVGGVAGDGDVVVVEQEFDGQLPGHRVTGRLGVAALLLGAVTAEQENRAAGVGLGHAVHMAPQVAEPAGAEEDAVRVAALGVAVVALAEFPVVEQGFGRLVAVEHAHDVLQGHAMAGLVEVDRVERVRAFHEAVGDEHLGDDVKGAAGVAAQPLGVRQGGEEDDAVAYQADVFLQGGALLRVQPGLIDGQAQRPVGRQIKWKVHGQIPDGE